MAENSFELEDDARNGERTPQIRIRTVMPIAITRSVPPSIVNCELTHLTREPIDITRAVEQHRLYEQCLIALGCTIERLPPLSDLPDSVFVEDIAVILPELAIITRPGAESRRTEAESVADALRAYRPLVFIESPGTVDGGDVLTIGTNRDGIRQLIDLVSAHGYVVEPVTVSGCLHLKSAVTRVAEDVVLLNPEWIDASVFSDLHSIEVDPGEPSAANALLIGEAIIYSTAFEQTLRRLEQRGIDVRLVDVSELQKAEGAVTCCSLLLA